MNVSVNLLPDVRQARLHDQHVRRLVTSLCILVWIVAGGVVVALLLTAGALKLQKASLDSQISSNTKTIQAIPHLNDALTAQAALSALPGLYSQRSYYSVFLQAVAQISPTDVFFSSFTTDPTGALTVSGTGNSVASVDKFYTLLKMSGGTANPTFSDITITNISKDQSNKAAFSLTATVNPASLETQDSGTITKLGDTTTTTGDSNE